MQYIPDLYSPARVRPARKIYILIVKNVRSTRRSPWPGSPRGSFHLQIEHGLRSQISSPVQNEIRTLFDSTNGWSYRLGDFNGLWEIEEHDIGVGSILK